MRDLPLVFVLSVGMMLPGARLLAQTDTSRARPDSSGCLFSGWPKPALASESGLAEGAQALARDELFVRVVSVHTGQPIAKARVLWSPGNQWVLTDSAGVASIRRLAQGRYELRVGALGFMETKDSITLGFDGVRVLAALTNYRGDIICTMPMRKPSSDR